ncbi:hypothetical protein PBI_SUZY_69 [Gordonia phage Suzy]|uniref:Uncharacterized protein n=1 Tax=Gordonia phage Suzy TaxID=2201430 RepID=A0A2Z4Q9F8_9CAUD|nr:hypothetical protein HOT44_gp69 [Gordonia phage Suzy]AWY06173.1 hypothetical protein PBI_SUZY_69 [Gordonia phage Suzy]
MSFLEGHRITGKLCSAFCDRPSGCGNSGPQYAGKVLEDEMPSSFEPGIGYVRVQVVSCPERPEAVGNERTVSSHLIEHLD